MNIKFTILTGILFAFISILMYSLGSHAIKDLLEKKMMTDSYQIACSFTMYHALALILLGLLMKVFPDIKFGYVAIGFITGSLLFQGVIFLKAFSEITKLGFLNPVGGSILFLSWILFFYLVLKNLK
ncbi:MAG: DUF423 domain-containing protein [Bacteroidales bacterium]